MGCTLALLSIYDGGLQAQSTGIRERSVKAVHAEHPPRMDGAIDQSWATAATVSDFKQQEPFEGRPATERTTVAILYDSHSLYFGIHCFDSDPHRIIANQLQRDGDYTTDDSVSILISPDNDRRNAYIFTVNPLGTQFDESLFDEGKIEDPNWDGIWTSNAHVTDDGWTATVAIPFSTLNFKTSPDVTVGLNFRRFIRRKNETDLWQSYLRIYGLQRVSEGGELTGLKDIGSGRLFLFKPYAVTGFRDRSDTGTQALHSLGFDLKYGLRSDLVANVTVNPDLRTPM